MKNIRNFSIIAHIDHGKSTLADRMLEITKTVERRKMREQLLDSMDLERERGITIKMQPVRMEYHSQALNPKSEIRKSFEFDASDLEFANSKYILNLIDTPGHIDFSYEVSRALKAVEGAVLLVDSTQGVQAQTLSVLSMAREEGLTILPVVTKIDSPLARVVEVKEEISNLLDCSIESILEVSGKTGEGVENLLNEVIKRVPEPNPTLHPPLDQGMENMQALIFDFKYSPHRGILVFVRVVSGSVRAGEKLVFRISGKEFISGEVGVFTPEEIAKDELTAGEIGYIVTSLKEPGIV